MFHTVGEGGETQNEATEGRKRHNLFPGTVEWKTKVLNKTKERSMEQQEILMLFLFPWMNVESKRK
jgi:hypothetical protein